MDRVDKILTIYTNRAESHHYLFKNSIRESEMKYIIASMVAHMLDSIKSIETMRDALDVGTDTEELDQLCNRLMKLLLL